MGPNIQKPASKVKVKEVMLYLLKEALLQWTKAKLRMISCLGSLSTQERSQRAWIGFGLAVRFGCVPRVKFTQPNSYRSLPGLYENLFVGEGGRNLIFVKSDICYKQFLQVMVHFNF